LIALNARVLANGVLFRPDVVLCAHVVAAPACLTLAGLLRAPIVSYVYADEVPARPLLSRLVLRSSTRTIAISGYARELALVNGARASGVRVVPPGVDLPGPPTSTDKEARPTFITVSRLTDRYKGHDLLLRALPAVRARVPDVQWFVVGDGPLRAELEESARVLGVEGSVSFFGEVSDAERDSLLARSHVFVMPSRLPPDGAGGEGFGIVYLEAALHGIPAVAGGVAGAVDAVLDGETGLLVDSTDEVAIADAVAGLLLDLERAERLGRAAERHARRFTWDRMAEEVDVVLREAMGS
jgi:phosphatidylinositol alpha-1,6-mannosyltransferase